MHYYIATVYVLTSMVGVIEGDAGISRRVIRLQTTSPEMFKAEIMDRYLHDVDAEIDFGPVSLSKKQTHDTN
jgi:hypothetical protein